MFAATRYGSWSQFLPVSLTRTNRKQETFGSRHVLFLPSFLSFFFFSSVSSLSSSKESWTWISQVDQSGFLFLSSFFFFLFNIDKSIFRNRWTPIVINDPHWLESKRFIVSPDFSDFSSFHPSTSNRILKNILSGPRPKRRRTIRVKSS